MALSSFHTIFQSSSITIPFADYVDSPLDVQYDEDEVSYKILCSTKPKYLQSLAGSYRARCIQFKSWLDESKCAPSVDITFTLEGLPSRTNHTIQYNATMYVKAIPPSNQVNLGRVFVDVVDGFNIEGRYVPKEFEVIVQTSMHGSEVFPDHTIHTVEHMYSSYPQDMKRIDPEYIPEIHEKDVLQVGTVCSNCPMPSENMKQIPDGVNMTMINEAEQGEIEKWFLSYMSDYGWTGERVNATIHDPRYGQERLYTAIFQKFDVLIVTPKKWYTKLRYGSIQRITSQMRSGTPVLVEMEGLAFTYFLEQYNYTCVFSNNIEDNKKYPTLEQALLQMKDVAHRRSCQEQGLKISSDFSPDVIGKQLLRVLGYVGKLNC